MNKKVSIITPTYNSEQFVKETIESILAQTYANWELLITDDCSTDSTWHVIREYSQQDSRIKVFKLDENSGAGVARNNSIKEASGRFIAFLDSDDTWHPEKLEKQVAFMLENSVSLSYTAYTAVDESGRELKLINPPLELTYKTILRNDYIGCLTAMYDAGVLGKRFMPTIRKRQDWALWLVILKDCKKALGISETLAYYTVRKNSISANKFRLVKYNWNIYRWLGYGGFKSSLYMVRFLYFYFLYKLLGKY